MTRQVRRPRGTPAQRDDPSVMIDSVSSIHECAIPGVLADKSAASKYKTCTDRCS